MVDMERHSRHILLPQVGVEGQSRISNSRVLCVGAGGLGSPVIQYLAAAGIGHLTIVDDDRVDLSNLQRQVIHRTTDVGEFKAISAKRFVSELDPNISVDSIVERVCEDNAKSLFENHDIIIDGTDNIPTRYLIDDTCAEIGIPWVYGSVYRFEGQVSTFNYAGGPLYRDLFPEAPPEHLLPSCSEAGVMGVLPGIIGCLQVTEVIKIITGIGAPLAGKLLIFDSLDSSFRTLSFGSPISTYIEESEPSGDELMFHSINARQAIEKINEGWDPYFIDVRSQLEWNQSRISRSVDLCPHDEILSATDRIPKDRDVLVQCRSGQRSQLAILFLLEAGYDASKMYNLDGGIIGWSEIDPNGITTG